MIKAAIKLSIGLVILALLLWSVDLNALWHAIINLRLIDVFNLGLASVILIYISAVKWGLFLDFIGAHVKISRLFALYLVGYFVNLIMPSYLGGDVVRSFYVGKKVGQHEALASTILERYTGLVAMVLLALCCMWFVSLVTFEIKLAIAIVALGLAFTTFVALADWPLRTLDRYVALKPLVKNLHKIQAGFLLVGGNYKLLVKALGLSVIYHCFTVLNTVAAAWAVGWSNPPFLDLFVVLPVILLVSALPLTPQGLGLQEGAFYFFLQALGATAPQALGVAVVLRAKSYILAAIGGLIWWVDGAHSSEDRPQKIMHR